MYIIESNFIDVTLEMIKMFTIIILAHFVNAFHILIKGEGLIYTIIVSALVCDVNTSISL